MNRHRRTAMSRKVAAVVSHLVCLCCPWLPASESLSLTEPSLFYFIYSWEINSDNCHRAAVIPANKWWRKINYRESLNVIKIEIISFINILLALQQTCVGLKFDNQYGELCEYILISRKSNKSLPYNMWVCSLHRRYLKLQHVPLRCLTLPLVSFREKRVPSAMKSTKSK